GRLAVRRRLTVLQVRQLVESALALPSAPVRTARQLRRHCRQPRQLPRPNPVRKDPWVTGCLSAAETAIWSAVRSWRISNALTRSSAAAASASVAPASPARRSRLRIPCDDVFRNADEYGADPRF